MYMFVVIIIIIIIIIIYNIYIIPYKHQGILVNKFMYFQDTIILYLYCMYYVCVRVCVCVCVCTTELIKVIF